MHVCLVYDCLFPWTVGGAERWYRALAERLAEDGYEVTYLTLRQWERGAPPVIPGVRVVAVGPRLALYGGGRRRLGPPLVFGLGVFWHLLRRGRRYGVVHAASFPFFPLLAAAVLRRRGGFRIVVDWHEVWTRASWRSYLGPVVGVVGWAVQRRCLRVPQRAFCFSHLHLERLRSEGFRGEATLLRGEYDGPIGPPPETSAGSQSGAEPEDGPFVVYAGRHIREKRVPALIAAVAAARRSAPDLGAVVFGDGPERAAVARAVAEHGLGRVVALPGFVDEATLAGAVGRALCLVLPSRREGYGLVVVEAAARGTPSVVVRGPDNAATELIEEGVNGFVAPSASAADLAAAILRVRAAGPALRRSTAAWFAANADRLSLRGSLDAVVRAYAPASNDREASGQWRDDLRA